MPGLPPSNMVLRNMPYHRNKSLGTVVGKPPVWFWVVAAFALLWALLGCASYLHEVTMSPAAMAALPAAQQEIWRATPNWLLGVFAIAVWIGLAGAVALLLRRRIARSLYVVSLVAVIVQFGWIFTQTRIFQLMSFGAAATFPIAIAVIGAALISLSDHAIRRGWLR